MNISPRLLERLGGDGHFCQHVAALGLQRATDRAILELAERESAILLTFDLDYGFLLNLEGKRSPSVIILRTTNPRPDYVYRLLSAYWERIEPFLLSGALVIVEDTQVRVRELPIEEEQT